MEAARTLLSSPPPFPPRTHLKNCLSSSGLVFHEQSIPPVTSVPTTAISRNFPTSILLQEQREEFRPLMNILKEDKTSEAMLDRRQREIATSVHDETHSDDSDQLMMESEYPSLTLRIFWNLVSSFQSEESPSWALSMQSFATNADKLVYVEPTNAIELAKRALSASKEAVFLAQRSTEHEDTVSTSSGSICSSNFSVEDVKFIKSTRRLERHSKRRTVPKAKEIFDELYYSRRPDVQKKMHQGFDPQDPRPDVQKKMHQGFDPQDPLRLFLRGPETKQLLSAKEESELIAQVQDLMKLEEVEKKLKFQFGREPTFVEWADAVGLSYPVLQAQLRSGYSSREKLITSNLRMVVHIAKQYHGRGLSLQDLLQEGSMGLMKSIEKFKPQVGCRFGTYAYWWIRQTVRKAIFQHSRTIRLPENVYNVLGKVMEAKRLYIQEGNTDPSKEQLAKRAGITVARLEKVLFMARMPLSMQRTVWADQETTFQEITADPEIEVPDVSVEKQLMRQHVRGLLKLLKPRERQIIRLRYGIEDGKQKSLSEIGNVFGLSKERVRQLERKALHKLKQCLATHGLDAYADLLV